MYTQGVYTNLGQDLLDQLRSHGPDVGAIGHSRIRHDSSLRLYNLIGNNEDPKNVIIVHVAHRIGVQKNDLISLLPAQRWTRLIAEALADAFDDRGTHLSDLQACVPE